MKEKFKVGDKVVIVKENETWREFYHDMDWGLGDIFEIVEITEHPSGNIYWSQTGVPLDEDFKSGVMEEALRLATPLEKALL